MDWLDRWHQAETGTSIESLSRTAGDCQSEPDLTKPHSLNTSSKVPKPSQASRNPSMASFQRNARTRLARKESRWPGYYYKFDYLKLDEGEKHFINVKYDVNKKEWTVLERPMIPII